MLRIEDKIFFRNFGGIGGGGGFLLFQLYRTPLHLACANGHVEIVSLLLSVDADPSITDRWGGTPFTDAVRFVLFVSSAPYCYFFFF